MRVSGGGREERHESGPDSFEGIGGGKGRYSVFQNEVAVHEILELFGGLQSGSGLTLSHKPLGPADELSDSRDRTSRAGSGAATLSDKSVGMGMILHGEDGVEKATARIKPRSSAKAGSRKRPLRKSAKGIFRERK